jgi:hypothetical protein
MQKMMIVMSVMGATFGALGLAGCNGTPQAQNVANDWIRDGTNTPPPAAGDNSNTSTPPGTPPGPETPPTETPSASGLYTGPTSLEPYVSKFVADALIQGVDVLSDMKNPKLEIRIESLDAWGSTTIGLCETAGNLRRVTFDPDFWNQVSETQRELLVHHELGHCVLYRAHTTAKLTSGAVASLMYPIIMSSSTYTSNYDYYQKELFTTSALSSSGFGNGESQTHVCGATAE